MMMVLKDQNMLGWNGVAVFTKLCVIVGFYLMIIAINVHDDHEPV
jgi:hypothetical protein